MLITSETRPEGERLSSRIFDSGTILKNSLKAAYSPIVSGPCSKCGNVVQQTTKVVAQQAEYHFSMISGAILDINSESKVSMFGYQWKIRGFAGRMMVGRQGHFVSWVRVLDHWYLVDDDQSEDRRRQAANIMILVFEEIL
ncbi:hypothetical protein L5515_019024 [Caenorhabditis briggsae]|uniref:USP domain-containing protein n=1 Tax=Caenorhabditis briggsae TaxID=6238 RepID=A0AAE9FIU0_CAEBR|nr:hypothetical protein L5515_019024 [Caenorhabditis briggsae]